ncbi:hypothetical protein ACFPM3_33560 [Streptomyces coeruleoprunus]|uniref:ABM domain-containing protein n=1 Tax=Streptomyces coeruleoprunus TaxID=285563 RepID=A0ABV9XNS6_9ACTN
MPEPIFYVDRSDIREGRLEEVRAAMRDLASFVEEREPRLLSYNFHTDPDGTGMTVVALHPDPASLEFHLDLGGPKFRAFGPLITLRAIDVYGDPGEAAVRRLHDKAALLGGGTVTVHTRQAGFSRVQLVP